MSRRRKQTRRRPTRRGPADAATLSEALEELHDNPDQLSAFVRHVLGTTRPGDHATLGQLRRLHGAVADNDTLTPYREPNGPEWASTWAVPVEGTDTVVIHHATGASEHYDVAAIYGTTRDEIIAREHDMGVDVAKLNPWRTGGDGDGTGDLDGGWDDETLAAIEEAFADEERHR